MTQSWNLLITQLPSTHFLQTEEWGRVKAKYGWQPYYAAWTDSQFHISPNPAAVILEISNPQAAALILKRSISIGGFGAKLSILYCPKGPLLDWTNQALRRRVLDGLQDFARQQGAIFLKCDPDVELGRGIPDVGSVSESNLGTEVKADLAKRGWVYAREQIQFRNTVLIDLNPTEEEILARMKQKTRYNVRLASKKGVVVRAGNEADWQSLYKMYAETSIRDGFVIRDEKYYRTVWGIFSQPGDQPYAEPLIAEVDGEIVAAIVVFYFAQKAYYVYGMSRDAHREKMPTYLLQWEAIRRAKSRGCNVYDLWGAPEVFDPSDSMWGVYRFKEGLGGEVVRTLGAYDYVPNKLVYNLYTDIMPRVLEVMRNQGKKRTQQQISM